ncbi:MAG: redoxin family protein [Bacteroidetes bacterium]|nr:redoxin family protein [Bacteroidota bacterium]
MKIFLTSFLAFTAYILLGADVHVHGRFTVSGGNMPPMVVMHNAGEEMADISAIVKDGAFSIDVPVTAPALYNVRLGRSSYDLMLSPHDKDINIDVSIKDDEVTDMQVSPSAESEAYKRFYAMMKLNDGKMERHFRQCEGTACEQDLHDLLLDYRDDLNEIRKRYPGTYAADVLCTMRMPTVAADIKNTTPEFRAHYFDSVPFADPSLLATPVYHDMIVNYIDFLIEGTLSSEEAFIRGLMAHARVEPKIYNKTALSLFDGLLWHSREKMLAMLIRYYDENEPALNNPVLAAKIHNIRTVMPGNNYKDVAKPDTGGIVRSLKEVVQRSRCTLLLFWSPGCSHCTEEMPHIQAVYDKYHSKGFDIYAYCMDISSQHWRSYLHEHSLPWTNVLAGFPEEGKPTAGNDYAISSTPTLVLIDKNGIILHRFAPKNKLEKYIEDALK